MAPVLGWSGFTLVVATVVLLVLGLPVGTVAGLAAAGVLVAGVLVAAVRLSPPPPEPLPPSPPDRSDAPAPPQARHPDEP